jgi:hypothetical protein
MTISKPEAAQKTVDRVLNVLGNRSGSLPKESTAPAVAKSATHHQEFDFTALPEYEILKIKRAVGDIVGLENPFLPAARRARGARRHRSPGAWS